jgi:proteic killer suppression protein
MVVADAAPAALRKLLRLSWCIFRFLRRAWIATHINIHGAPWRVRCRLLDVERVAAYNFFMIRSFKDRDTAELAQVGTSRRWRSIESVARRKLNRMDAASRLEDLRDPPGNMLEPLKGNRRGQYSIRINDQFRICFVRKEDGAYDVEIVDYHRERKGRK